MSTLLITGIADPPRHDFTAAEMSSLRRDGLVRELLPQVWAAASLGDTSELRAVAAKHTIGRALLPRVVVGWASAAWVYGWGTEPCRLEVLIDQSKRTTSTHRAYPHLLIHEVQDPLDRSLSLAGVFVSDPVRTVLDVARHCGDEDARRILVRAFQTPDLIESVQTHIRLGGLYVPQRHRSRMHSRLSRAAKTARLLQRQRAEAPQTDASDQS